jgi:predicted MFS family arabinose efflux permease
VNATPTRVKLRALLADHDLRRLLGAQFLAQAADGMAQAALADIAIFGGGFEGAPGRVLRLTAFTLLPYSLIAPFLGVFVDRWHRRTVLIWTNAIRAIVLGALFIYGRFVPGDIELYAAVLLLLGLGRLFLTVKGAVLPVLMHEHHLLRGNAVSGGGGMMSALAGGAVGLVISGRFGATTAFTIAGVVYGVSAFFASKILDPLGHSPEVESARETAERVVRDLISGLREILSRPRARIPLVAIFILRTVGIFVAISSIRVITEEFTSVERFGRLSSGALALGAAGLGAFVGAITAPLVGRRLQKGGLVVLGFVVSGLGILALGGVRSIAAVLALTFFGGYGGFVSKIAVDAQVQEALPDDYRGRAFALYDILYNFASVVAAAIMVPVPDESLRMALVGSGVITLILGAAMASWMRAARIPLLKSEVSTLPADT